MKFSKLLAMLLGFAGLFQLGVVEGGGGGGGGASEGGALDANQAGELFTSLLDQGEPNDKNAGQESPEAAAERLAAEELAAQQGGKEGEGQAADGAGDDAGAAKITVKIDGKDVQLTEAEIAEHYKNGLRQADYTRKTMEAADARKSAEAEANAARQERQNYANQLNIITAKLQGDLQEQSKIDWQQLLATDPVAYLEQKRIFEERQAHLSKAQQEMDQLQKLHQTEQAESARQYLAKQQQELIAKLPEWKDVDKAKAESAQIKEYLAKEGFEKGEIEQVADHRIVFLFRKAMLYDGLMSRAAAAPNKVAKLPTRVERPGNGDVRPDGRTQAMQRLAKTGSINDAAAAFSEFLG